jgi:hypothetical protein
MHRSVRKIQHQLGRTQRARRELREELRRLFNSRHERLIVARVRVRRAQRGQIDAGWVQRQELLPKEALCGLRRPAQLCR